MLYVVPAAIAVMSGYVAWLLLFRLRKDRVLSERDQTRGKFAFQPKNRLRFLLNRTFPVPDEKAKWEDPLVSRLQDRGSETSPVSRDSPNGK